MLCHEIFFVTAFAVSVMSTAYVCFLYLNYSAFIRNKAILLYTAAWMFCVMCAVMNGGWVFGNPPEVDHVFLAEASLMQVAAMSMINLCFTALCKAYRKMRHMSKTKINDAIDAVRGMRLSTSDTADVLKDLIAGNVDDALKLDGELIRNDMFVIHMVTAISSVTLFISIVMEALLKLKVIN